MRILGIDYGKKKIGLSLADTAIATPLKVIRSSSDEYALGKIAKVIEDEKIAKVVVGVSEGKIAKEAKMFGAKLSSFLKIPVDYYDETLTTAEAQRLAREAGIGQRKLKRLEDAYSASLILQGFLESQKDRQV